MVVIRPQPGPQEQFLACSADIVLYGGSAGGGKSYALLMELLRNTGVKDFSAVTFRRTTRQLTNPGGLWHEASSMYADIPGTRSRENDLTWFFPAGSTLRFAHMEHEKNRLDWQGSQIPLICFDELTHFTPGQFWYMLSRNRSVCGVNPYIRATTNPDADSWVAELIAWWIDQETGLAIPDRSGVVRWFIRLNDKLIWADTKEELIREHGTAAAPKSFTFISAKLSDNKVLMEKDPSYLANLMALTTVERGRLLDGNWKIKPSAGLHFQRGWCRFIEPEEIPKGTRWARGWDLASTPKTELNDPDFTVGVKIGITPEQQFIVADVVEDRATAGAVKLLVENTASFDGRGTVISIPKDPGQAGKFQVTEFVKALRKYTVTSSPENGDKITRFGPFSSQAEHGNVLVVKGPWNSRWIAQLEGFPEMAHDDHVDATSRAYEVASKRLASMIQRMRDYVH